MKTTFLSLALFVALFVGAQSTFAQTDTLSGRLTNFNGQGIAAGRVKIDQFGSNPFCNYSTTSVISTNAFGYYSMEINYYCSILVTPTAKRYTFTPTNQFFNPGQGSYTNVDFVGN